MSSCVMEHWLQSPILSLREELKVTWCELWWMLAAAWVLGLVPCHSHVTWGHCHIGSILSHSISSVVFLSELLYAYPYEIPTLFTSLMVIHWLTFISTFTFAIVSACTEVEGLYCEAHCSVVLSHFWSGCMNRAQLFFEAHNPHKQFASPVVFLQHCFIQFTWTLCWLFAWTHLHSDSSSTQQTGSNVQPLPTHAHREVTGNASYSYAAKLHAVKNGSAFLGTFLLTLIHKFCYMFWWMFVVIMELIIQSNLYKLNINPLNAELNPICHLLALVGARHIVHVSRIRVKSHPPFASIGRSPPYCPR